MIQSMTACARESAAVDGGALTVELRSVNHRYLDCSIKLPDALRALEPVLRDRLGKAVARGKLDCLLRWQPTTEHHSALNIDREQLHKLLTAAAAVEAELTAARPLSALEVLSFPGVCGSPQQPEEELREAALSLFDAALASLADTRAREGVKLAAAVEERLATLGQAVADLRGRLPQMMQQQRDRVVSRIQELDLEADSARLEQELVYMAQKADVAEELDRLDAHVTEVERVLRKGGPSGRRLDFLMQELNREANTLSSKSFTSDTTQTAVDLKVLIEQMREQVQNIQ